MQMKKQSSQSISTWRIQLSVAISGKLSLVSKASALKATELNATTAKATLLNALEMFCSYLGWPR